jgi:hypothetical protein
MRKTALIVTLLAAVVGGAGYFCYQFLDKNSNEARAYAEEAVCETTYYWQPATLFGRATDMYKQYHDYNSTIIFCSANRNRFGCIQSFEHPYGSLGIDFRHGRLVLTGDYVVVGNFAGSKGAIKIAVVRLNGEWKVDDFQIQSGIPPDYEDNAAQRALAPKLHEDAPPKDTVASQ